MTRLPPGAWLVPFTVLGVAMWAGLIWATLALLSPRAEVITHDPGGSIQHRIWAIEGGAAPVIAGYCASACVMHLTGGCVMPGAVLVFHGPRDAQGGPLDPAAFDRWSRLIARHLPPAIADWYLAEGRFGTWRMTGAEAIRLGARGC